MQVAGPCTHSLSLSLGLPECPLWCHTWLLSTVKQGTPALWLAQSPLVRFTALQKYNWVLSGTKTLERGGEGLRGMWKHARGEKCLSHGPYSPPPHRDSNYTEILNTLFHWDQHMALTPYKPWGSEVLGLPLVLLQIWIHLSAVMEVLRIHSQCHQSVIWPCSKTWEQISSTRNIMSMCLLFGEKLIIRPMNIICVCVHACVCLHIPNMCHVVWYRSWKDTCLEKPQTILVGSICNLGKSMSRGKDIKWSYGKCCNTVGYVITKNKTHK